MNSRSRSENAQRAASSFNNHDFDFGLGASLSRSSPASGSLNAQKQQNAAHTTFTSSVGGAGVAAGGASRAQKPIPSSSSSSWSWSSSSLSSASSSASTWSWQSSSGGSLHAAPRSMVGDIMGKSWGSLDTSKVGTAKSGLVGGLSKGAAPDLFGDLVGAACLPSSVPMEKQQQRQGSKSSTFSNIEAMAASLPRGVPIKDAKAAKLNVADDMGVFVSVASITRANSSSQDNGWAAFEGLSSGLNSAFSHQANVSHSSFSKSQGRDPFRDFQGVPTSTTAASPATTTANVDPFAASSNANIDFSNDISKSAASTSDDFFNLASNVSAADDFFNLASNVSAAAPPQTHAPEKADASGFFSTIGSDPLSFLNSRKTTASQLNGTTHTASDPFESVLGRISNLSARPKPEDSVMENLWSSTKTQPGLSTQNMPDDWGLETHFGGDDSATTTTELDGLPPPPAGVSASLAKDKGLENYKQGQFADAIKWLSWAEVLFEKRGESSWIIEVLTCRSSCLKEAGEYKKAVADCSKVIELDDGNTAVLLQRALLYESMEKYKLGIADLKEVLKREPQNRLANNTLSRLRKMGE